jgi:hypothetical protein
MDTFNAEGGFLFTQRRFVGLFFPFFLHRPAQELDTIPLTWSSTGEV